jgi:hypothetical protein
MACLAVLLGGIALRNGIWLHDLGRLAGRLRYRRVAGLWRGVVGRSGAAVSRGGTAVLRLRGGVLARRSSALPAAA